MRLSSFLALALLDVCTAQNGWALKGCDTFNPDGIRDSFDDARSIAGTAVDIINRQSGHDKVQSMAKFILGDDTPDATFQEKLDKSKNVAKYSKTEVPDILKFNQGEYVENRDLIIYCDDSNFIRRNLVLVNEATGLRAEDEDEINDCYSQPPPPRTPTAITSPSDATSPKYKPLFATWLQGGQQGAMPDRRPYIIEQRLNPNTMNLCKWFLDVIGKNYFARIDDTNIARTANKDFLADAPSTAQPIDALASTLAGTLLHELTHTVTGNRSVDVDLAGGCYGWECVGNLHSPDNADSIAILGICMHLFSKGYWVDTDGSVKRI